MYLIVIKKQIEHRVKIMKQICLQNSSLREHHEMTEKEKENSHHIQGCCNSNFVLKLESYRKFDLHFLAWTEEKCRYGCVSAEE